MRIHNVKFSSVVLMAIVVFFGFAERFTFNDRLSEAAISIINPEIRYDPSYHNISYPMGDVPERTGVCTDVVIRAYRKLGIDLQEKVHLDMVSDFQSYPQVFGLKKPDANVDHRRVPNLMVFFKRNGESLPITQVPADFHPGEIVCWNLYGSVNHIGIVVNKKSADQQRFMVVHNIGGGQVMEDMLFKYRIIGHYYYDGH
ncbi:MAG: DUF1287 domain-containing protein [Bacteroidia bacterium]